jgi:LPXTG-motif cell wall-anchored protein
VPSTTTTAPVTTTTSPVTTTTLGQLPHTGGNVVAPLMFGLGLMVLGVIARRRTSRA